MNDSFPGPDRKIVRHIAAIMAKRQTGADEVPAVLDTLRQVFERLSRGESAAPPAAGAAEAASVREPQRQEAAAPRRRGRPPKIAPPPASEERQRHSEPVVAAAPRLMRRAEVAPAEPAAGPLAAPKPRQIQLRGVVRWFDPRTRQGMLRLPGFSDDVPIAEEAVARAGIARLYKGQEIEATVEGENGQARVVGLGLPGRVAEANSLFRAGSARRNARPVVVEMKRDALRRAGARVEAEHVLGNGGRRP
jgi:cold shock CspA family protein